MSWTRVSSANRANETNLLNSWFKMFFNWHDAVPECSSNLKLANECLNIIRGIWGGGHRINFLRSCRFKVLLTYAGLNKLSLYYCKKKLSTILQLYEPLKVKATHIKSFRHHELLRYATIGYIINFGCDLQVVYSQHEHGRPLAEEVVKL